MPKYNAVADRDVFYARVLEGVRALPGVSAAAYVSFVPITGGGGIFAVGVDGVEPTDRTRGEVASMRYVTPGYFAAMGMPLRRGRDVAESDTAEHGSVAVVSESFVRRFFPDRDPIGRHFRFAYGDREIVGVVGDVRDWGPEQESAPQVYCAYRQMDDGKFTWYAPKDLIVRAAGTPTALTPSIRAIVRRVDATQPISDVQTLSAIVDGESAPREAQLTVLGAFAILAFVLAAIGIHGLLSFAVSERTQEIGVRIALGAQPRDILLMIALHGVRLAAVGLAVGGALAYAAGRWMEALLAGIEPGDARTFGAAIAIVAAMTLIGTVMPTVRALRIDPIRALRAE
jgi:predicted permease